MAIRKIQFFSLFLVLATSALYGLFLWNPIIFDDLPFFMVNGAGHQPVDDFRYSLFELRSLPYATLAWSKQLLGLDLIYFRIENLLLHVAVVVSLFFFLQKLFGRVMPQERSSQLSTMDMAFFAALIFAVHPVAVYAVAYLVQRTIVMATLFSVLAMWAWLKGLEDKRWLWLSALFYYLAVFSKEHSIMLPIMLMALTILIERDWKKAFRSSWIVWIFMAATALFVLAAKMGIIGRVYEVGAPEMLMDVQSNLSYPLSVLTQSALFFKYATLWIFPNPHWMSVDMREPFAQSVWSVYGVALFAYLACGIAAVWLLFQRGRWGLLGFGLLFSWVMFFAEFSTVRIQESFVLYRSYLWAIGCCVVLPIFFARMTRKASVVILVAVAVTLVPISMDRLSSFSHPLLLWDDAAKLIDDSKPLLGAARIYNNRGLEYLELQNYNEALEDFRRAIQLNPNMPSAYTNIGAVYLEIAQPNKAIAAFDEAIVIMTRASKVNSANPFYGKAKAFEALNKLGDAANNYAVSCHLGRKGCDRLDVLTAQLGRKDRLHLPKKKL